MTKIEILIDDDSETFRVELNSFSSSNFPTTPSEKKVWNHLVDAINKSLVEYTKLAGIKNVKAQFKIVD